MDNLASKGGPMLRLVNAGVAPGLRVTDGEADRPHDLATAAELIEQENAQVARSTNLLSATDARWVFAVRVASALASDPDAGRAGILRPERRQRLLAQAKAMGLRPFDASLIVAVVQESAASGRGPLSPGVAARVEMMAPPEQPTRLGAVTIALGVVGTIFAAGGLAAAVLGWLLV